MFGGPWDSTLIMMGVRGGGGGGGGGGGALEAEGLKGAAQAVSRVLHQVECLGVPGTQL